MATSTAPPPKSSGNRAFVIAVLAMLLLAGGLLIWKVGADDPPPDDPPPPPPPTSEAPAIDQTLPPPPPIPSEDAAAPPPSAKKVGAGSTYCSSCGKCTGTAPGNLASSLRSRASQAQRCYEKALAQQEGLEGKMTLNLCVGAQGQVCSAGIGADSLRSQLVSQCVLNIFRSTTFPAPKNGCVEAQVPLNFVAKKP